MVSLRYNPAREAFAAYEKAALEYEAFEAEADVIFDTEPMTSPAYLEANSRLLALGEAMMDAWRVYVRTP